MINPDETARLRALRELEVLDTPPERELDDIVRAAAAICNTPIALLSLTDELRHWFKASIGFERKAIPRDEFFFAQVLEQNAVFEISDAQLDPRFASHPLVTTDTQARFYAGAPLRTREGYAIGTLCVLDRKPRRLTDGQRQALEALARQTIVQLELRRRAREVEEISERQREAEARIRTEVSVSRPIPFPSLPRIPLRKAAAIPAIVLIASLALTAGAWRWAEKKVREGREVRFQRETSRIEDQIRDRVMACEHAVRSGAALFRASSDVTRDEWRAFAESLYSNRYPGIVGIGFVSRVDANEVGGFVERVRAGGASRFSVHPGGQRDEFLVVTYVAPEARNERLLGFDIGVERIRKAAAERARDEGRTALSERVTLHATGENAPGFVLFEPLFSGTTPATVAERRRTVRGWVFAVLRASEVMKDVGRDASDVAFEVYDGTADGGQLLHRSSRPRANENGIESAKQINLFGRGWIVHFAALPAFGRGWEEAEAPLILGGGVLFSVLLTALAWSFSSTRVRALEMARAASGEYRDSEARVRAIVDQLADAVLVIRNGRIESFNQAAERLFGYSPSGIVGKKPALLIPKSETWPRDGTPHETAGRHKSGREIPVEIAITEVEQQDEDRIDVAIVRDITERRRVQEELARARDLAIDSARLKSEFLANMSHEIRTPMNGVIGMTEVLLATKLTEEQRDMAQTVQASADTLLRVINDILDFSKVEAGKLTIETIDFDLGNLLEQITDFFAEAADRKRVELALMIDPNVDTRLRGDPLRIRQVLSNLVSNAIKFTPRGEVILSASVEQDAPANATIRFSVTDTGIGIPEPAQQGLFDPFIQADGSTTREYGGTGLGLAISKQIVTLMRGDMGVVSEEGKGSTFWFTVPFSKQLGREAVTSDAAILQGIRVLVVDDNATNRRILEQHFSSWSLDHLAVTSAAEALSALLREASGPAPFDVVLTDHQMPDIDGLTLVRQIRGNPRVGHVKIVVLTSFGRRREDQTAIGAYGIDGFIVKPIKQSQLFDILCKVVAETPKQSAPRPDLAAGEPGTLQPEPISGTALDVRPDVRVLLVEDTEINRRVALRQLVLLGIRAEVATDGLQAVSMSGTRPYDLIFMDCQMPNMDGFEATAAIRECERDRHTIIIAMTANALEGDRERCLAAGMDDYIAKPVQQKLLRQVVARWLGEASSVLNPEILEGLRALGGDENPGFLGSLIEIFLSEAPERIGAIEAALVSSDAVQLWQSAHALKSGANNLGATRLVEISTDIERRGRAGDLAGAVTSLGALRAEFDRARDALERARKESTRRGGNGNEEPASTT